MDLLKLRFEEVRVGRGPERLVRFRNAGGWWEEVAIPRTSELEAARIGEDRDRILVELPRESEQGNWRVWINKDILIDKASR